MDDVLRAATELGLLIKDTDIYQEFARASAKVEADEEALELLQSYSRMAEDFQQRESAGVPIEVYEKDEFQSLIDRVRAHEILARFLETRDGYIEFLAMVQTAIDG